jgi:very-short-patch-repair endonuclease
VSALPTSNYIADERLGPSAQWRLEWAARAQIATVAHRGFVLRSAEAGRTQAEVRTLLRRRVWSAPRRGVLAQLHPNGDARVEAALAATAAALVRQGAVISHESAAILHGLPILWSSELPVLIAPARSGGRNQVSLHLTALEESERDDWYGAPVTSVARTVVDIARSKGRSAGLVTADAALREGLTTLEMLGDAVRAATGRPGNVAARWVSEVADPLSESPLESLTRAAILMSGLSKPQLQVWIPSAGARVDLLFAAERVVVEADGMLKYTDSEVLRDEKLRQERLERAGYRVVRVTWSDVTQDQPTTIGRINHALNR